MNITFNFVGGENINYSNLLIDEKELDEMMDKKWIVINDKKIPIKINVRNITFIKITN